MCLHSDFLNIGCLGTGSRCWILCPSWNFTRTTFGGAVLTPHVPKTIGMTSKKGDQKRAENLEFLVIISTCNCFIQEKYLMLEHMTACERGLLIVVNPQRFIAKLCSSLTSLGLNMDFFY